MRCLITPNTPVARELAPARLRSSRKTGRCTVPDETLWLGWGRFAAQREQAPSPREVNSQEIFRLPLVPLQGIQKALSLSGRLPNLDVPGQCDSPVGAGLLAKRPTHWLSHRHREQARSHGWLGLVATLRYITDQLWEQTFEHALLDYAEHLWRGSLLPLGCAAVVKPGAALCLTKHCGWVGAASQPSGSKLPRHGKSIPRRFSDCRWSRYKASKRRSASQADCQTWMSQANAIPLWEQLSWMVYLATAFASRLPLDFQRAQTSCAPSSLWERAELV